MRMTGELREFLDHLQSRRPEDLPAVVRTIRLLAERGNRIRMPHSRPLGEGLFELRVSLREGARRITYCFTGQRTVVLLTTFRKQRQVEHREVARARQVKQRVEE